ncbi:hypothetical protein FHT78_005009 [Rhizobium sp. BK196]|uniref:DUF982 domain-containing protein n=1 Tax=unclassified Rhizobium TaxID=2613769 RepID=UPI001608C63E|nr:MULTISPECIES: DUF982 domain-containing protein [unclassified Rhizobium]MBB3313217.1 hypothetical protein [Rhizobium sp. BK196]MBB3464334.1 hypothetical protein [Rhizobium sp. BK377]
MKWRTVRPIEPIVLVFPDKQRRKTVRTARDAAEALLHEWPHDDGEEFCAAVKVCLDVIIGRGDPHHLRTAMLRAAGEAGVIAIAAIH